MIKAIIFDLDGTLLPMNENKFTSIYFENLYKKLKSLGFEKEKLITSIMYGTKLMVNNNGKSTNEDVFWKYFSSVYGNNILKQKSTFEQFYDNEFEKTMLACTPTKDARKIIDYVKNKKLKAILASNPVFPQNGMLKRLSFIGLNKKDFSYLSSYEICHYSKPNPMFFNEILKTNKLKPNEVIYFGNSIEEDYLCASSVGIKTFLIEDENQDYSKFENLDVIKLNQIIPTIDKILQQTKK